EIVHLNVKRLPNWPELEASGLMHSAAAKESNPNLSKASKQSGNIRHLPAAQFVSFDALYEESYKNARPTKSGDPNRSVVDFDVACRTLRASYRSGQTLADCCTSLQANLLRRAPKAKDKGVAYV